MTIELSDKEKNIAKSIGHWATYILLMAACFCGQTLMAIMFVRRAWQYDSAAVLVVPYCVFTLYAAWQIPEWCADLVGIKSCRDSR